MVGVVVQPDNHGRVPGQLDQDIVEAAQTMSAEHVYLVGEGAEVVELVLAGGEYAVPEQGYLLLERTLGRDEPVCPVGGVVALHGVKIDVATEDQVVRDAVRRRRVEELLHELLVADLLVGVQFLGSSAETGAACQVGYLVAVFGGHGWSPWVCAP